MSLKVTVTQTPVSCSKGSNGSATAHASEGSGTYTYLWSGTGSGGQTTATAINLPAGTYHCAVTDTVAAITVGVDVTLLDPVDILGVIEAHNPTSPTANNGWLKALPTGGTGTFTLLWSTGATTQIVTGLAPGTYTCSFTDTSGCTINRSATLVADVAGTPPTDFETKINNLNCCKGKLSYKVTFGQSIREDVTDCEDKLDTLTDLLIVLCDYDEDNPSNCLTSDEKDLLLGLANEICLQCGCS